MTVAIIRRSTWANKRLSAFRLVSVGESDVARSAPFSPFPAEILNHQGLLPPASVRQPHSEVAARAMLIGGDGPPGPRGFRQVVCFRYSRNRTFSPQRVADLPIRVPPERHRQPLQQQSLPAALGQYTTGSLTHRAPAVPAAMSRAALPQGLSHRHFTAARLRQVLPLRRRCIAPVLAVSLQCRQSDDAAAQSAVSPPVAGSCRCVIRQPVSLRFPLSLFRLSCNGF